MAIRVALLAALAASWPLQAQVTTYHYDTGRTGAVLTETILNTTNVDVTTFGKLFSLAVDGQIYAQPLYVPAVGIPSQGIHNVVYVATEHNSVYAFDADSVQAGPLWHVNLGPSMPQAVCCAPRDMFPEMGITSTPVIDLSTGTLYVVAETYENQVTAFTLHALDITTGTDKLPAATIQGSVPGTSNDSVNGTLTFQPIHHWQRPGLLLLNGNIYIGFASHQDSTPFHGWVFGYSEANLQRTGVVCLSPNSEENGVWQGGVGLAGDANGNVYAVTGNGPMDANTGGTEYGDSVVKIGTASGLAVVDYFSPSVETQDAANDWDLGSSGPTLLPGTSLAVVGGKTGTVYVVNTTNLGHFNSLTDQIVQEWKMAGGFWGGNRIYYNSTLYVFPTGNGLHMLSFNGSQFNVTPIFTSSATAPASQSNGPAMSISANGFAAGTGVVWTSYDTTGTADGGPHPGILRAFDASNVSRELWNSNQDNVRDYSGSWAKFSPPIVANGKVYLATFDNMLNVYGLLPGGATMAATAGGPQSATVGRAFTTALQATVKDAGNNPLTGVTVTFAAPGTGAAATFSGSATAVTNASGIATAPALTANSQAGTYTVTASAAGVATPASFRLTNLPGPPASVSAAAGTPQSATINATFTTALQAAVNDASGNPVSGVTVTFTASGTGARAAFSGSATATAVTNASGIATAPALTANGVTGNYTVTASVSGLASLADFSLTNISAIPASVIATAGTPQSATVNAAFATALQATVKDASSNPVSGVTVTFTAPATGASAAFSGSATATATTNASGIATASALTANGQAGSYTVTASVAGVTSPASFSLTNLSAVPASIIASVGTPQNAAVNTAFATALQATVKDGGGNPLSGVSVTFAAPASGPSATFGGSATVTTNTSGVATAPTLTANSQAGSYTVTASVAGVTTPAGFSLTNTSTTTGGSGSLSGSGNSNAGTFNLTTEGTSDWVTWGVISGGPGMVDRKAGVTAQISNYTEIGTIVVSTTGNDPRTLTWSDGTRATSGSNNVVVYVDSNTGHAGNGFSFTVPADTNLRTLVLHLSGQNSGGALTAHLSDGSAANYQDTTANQSGRWDRNYALSYSAASAGQSLTIQWVDVTDSGSVSLGGAAVSLAGSAGSASSVTATAGAPQSATVNTGFTTALQATVKDINGNPLSGVSVTFAAPASGASAAFGGSATVTTNSSGVATAPALTANGLAGSYAITASVAGVTTPASFSLTNLAGPPASVTATVGTPQSATVNTAFATALQATVKDGSGNPLSGVSVTFAAPASGASATFGASATVTTNASGVATAPALTGNGQAGGYTVTASVAGVTTPASFSLTNLAAGPASVTATGGTPQSATVNTAFTAALQAVVKDGSGNLLGGVSVTFAAPASGASAAFGGSATVTTNTSGVATAPSLTANGQAGSYTVTASVAGVTTPASFSLTNLAGSPASVTATSGTPQSATVNTAFTAALQAIVKDGSGNPLSGVSVTFAAPSSGASAAFGGSATVTTNTSGLATAPSLTANGQAGGYAVTASVAGVTTPASFSLTNLAAGPASVTATGGTPQSAIVNTAFTAALQAVVKDGSGNPLSGVSVTFAAPSSGASAAFGGSATVTTNTSGVATAPTLTANGQAGGYAVTASVAGVTTPASFSLTNTPATTSGGSLSGTGNFNAGTFNLTTEGTTDWVNWGIVSGGPGLADRKAGVTALIGNYKEIGSLAVATTGNDPRTLTWSDGTPAAQGSNNAVVYVESSSSHPGEGFSFTVPADTNLRTLVVHAGGENSGGQLTASLSDGSAANYQDTTASQTGRWDRNYTLTYSAASAGQTLTIQWIGATASGNVTLGGAALH